MAQHGRAEPYAGRAMNNGSPDGCDGRDDVAVNYKTRKRPDTVVYTITGAADVVGPLRGDDGGLSSCACCVPGPGTGTLRNDQQPQQHAQRRRPRTWTCGTGGGVGVTGLTRSRTFTSNYERAISSLLWQPYECRSSSNSLNDDGDVAVWLNATGRYEPLSSRSSLSLSTIPR